MSYSITRRSALGGMAAGATAMTLPQIAFAAGYDKTYKVIHSGAMKITTLLASTRQIADPHLLFGINISDDIFDQAALEAGLDPKISNFFFTPTLIETGTEKILFDTGTAPEHIRDSLEVAGHRPEEITKVVITHMHSDHIGGLRENETLTFSNAEFYTGEEEFDHWDFSGDEVFEDQVRPLSDADQFEFMTDGDSIAPGITAHATFGHTPGHMSYRIEADGKQFFLGGDFTNHYAYSLAHPEWHFLFDVDREMAAQTRRKTLDMLATDQIMLLGYHMPFPAAGYVEKHKDGFQWIAA